MNRHHTPKTWKDENSIPTVTDIPCNQTRKDQPSKGVDKQTTATSHGKPRRKIYLVIVIPVGYDRKAVHN